MADLDMRSSWVMRLETPELRLVLKALGGRLKDAEIAEAKTLGDHLTKLRVAATKMAMNQADKTLRAVEAATGDEP